MILFGLLVILGLHYVVLSLFSPLEFCLFPQLVFMAATLKGSINYIKSNTRDELYFREIRTSALSLFAIFFLDIDVVPLTALETLSHYSV